MAYKIIFLLFLISLNLQGVVGQNTIKDSEKENEYIILVNTFNYSHTWFSELQFVISEALKPSGKNIAIETFNGAELWDINYEEACEKFSSIYTLRDEKPKALVFVGSIGWELYNDTHPQDWHDIPSIISGIGDSVLNFKRFKNDNFLKAESIIDLTSGYNASINIRHCTLDKTVSLMRRVIPQIDTIYFLIDKSMNSQALRKYLSIATINNKDITYRFYDKTKINSRQLLDSLTILPPNSGVILISWFLEKDDPLYSPNPNIFYERLAKACPNPIFISYDIGYHSDNFIGGCFAKMPSLLVSLQKPVTNILTGKTNKRYIDDINQLLKSRLNYNVLRRYPEIFSKYKELANSGIIIDNRPLPYWKKNKNEIVIIIACVMIICILVFVEKIKSRRAALKRRKAQKQLLMSALIYDKMPTLYARYRLEYDEKNNIIDIVLVTANKKFWKEDKVSTTNSLFREHLLLSTLASLIKDIDKGHLTQELIYEFGQGKHYKLTIYSTVTQGEIEIFYNDISDFVRTQTKLKEYHLKQTHVYKNMPIAVAILDANFRMIDSNKAFAELLKTDAETMKSIHLNKRLFSIFDNHDINNIKNDSFIPREVVLNDSFINNLGLQSRQYSSPVVWCEVKNMSDDHSDTAFYSVILIEHSRIYQEVERIIRDSNMTTVTLVEVLNSLPAPLAIKDCEDQFKYVYWNKAAEEITGIKADDIIGKTDFEIDFMKQAEHLREEDLRVSLENITVEREMTHKDSFLISRKSCIEGQNRHKWLLSTKWDITSLKHTQLQLEQSKEKAEESNRLKSAFLANMSHEIRTPLNAIVGFSEVIVDAEDDAERAEYSKYILKNADLLLRLISDILELSKIESGIYAFNIEEISIKEIKMEIGVLLKKHLNGKTIAYSINGPTTNGAIVTDKARLLQIFNNIIINAAKFTTSGSINIKYLVNESKDTIQFDISDSGCGIPQDKLNAIFERFVKLDEFKQGVGLGLALCKAIISKMGGDIWATSQVNIGTVISFTLPYLDIQKQQEQLTQVHEVGCVQNLHSRKNILIAEDKDSNYKLFETILKDQYNLFHVKDGSEVMQCFNNNRPDLVFLDIKMPFTNGYDAISAIKKVDNKTPIIAVTAFALAEDKEQILKAGFDALMTKPIHRQDMLNIIDDLLN